MAFKKAVRTQAKARVVVVGPSGSGKSMTALRIARGLVGPEGRIAARDSEHGSLSKYAALPGDSESDTAFDFDVDEPATHSPMDYVRAIREAEQAGYDVIVIDSLSHEWVGTGGALEIVDQSSGSNAFTSGWKKVTPMHNELIDAINGSSIHVVATLRTKTEYVIEEDAKGKKVPRKVGMAPVQRDGIEYEFDLLCTIDRDHRLRVDKTRCPDLDDAVIDRPTAEVGQTLAAWLGQGEAPPKPLGGDERSLLAEAVRDESERLLSEAAEHEIAGAPQDEDSMQRALKLAAVAFLGIDDVQSRHVQPLLQLFKLAGLREDGSVGFPPMEDDEPRTEPAPEPAGESEAA